VRVSKVFVGALAVTAMVLTGCAAGSEEEAADPSNSLIDGCVPSGQTVETLVVSDNRLEAPDVEYEAPLDVSNTERLVVVEGDGEVVKDLDQVLISYALYSGGSGDRLGYIGYEGVDPVPFPVDVSSAMLGGVSYTLLCTTVGSRVVGVIPAHQAYGPEGAPQYGLEPGAPVIFVADLQAILPPPAPPLARVTGALKDAPEGYPDITYDMSGKPTVTVDFDTVARDFQMFRVIDGSGQEVYSGATVLVQYHGVNLNTGEVFDSSWERGEPASFPTSGVIPGFRDGLVGQNVGSRVLIIVPPALGYGPRGGTIDGSIGPDDTIFFVVDILGVL
jgi:peptidylprolyl isomerase